MVRLIVKNSIEADVIEIQSRKRQLASVAFNEKVKGEDRRAGALSDIEMLLR